MHPKPYNANKLVIILVAILILFNIAIVMILNSMSFKGTAERYAEKYLTKQGYHHVYVKQFVPYECSCQKNGGYEFEAIDQDGSIVLAKACSDGYGGFWVYEVSGCQRIETPAMRSNVRTHWYDQRW